jgi:hypothetical protein
MVFSKSLNPKLKWDLKNNLGLVLVRIILEPNFDFGFGYLQFHNNDSNLIP